MANNWNKNTSLTTLNTIIDGSIDTYQYKLARYLNDITVDLRGSWEYNPFNSYGFDLKQDVDLFKSADTNVIKSVTDALVSKLANQKVRPYFTPVNGTYKTRQIVKQVQRYFDVLFDQIDIKTKISNAFKQACIFNIGYIYLNPITLEVSNLPTWCIATLDSEAAYGKKTKMLIRYSNYPTTLLSKFGLSSNKQYVEFSQFIDTIDHKMTLFIDGREVKSIAYKADILPIVEVYYNSPVRGNRTVSIVDELDGIQTQIDLISAKISACAQLTPGNTTYVLEGSNLNPGDINNRVGNVYGIKCPPGMTTPPVTNVTPAPFDPMWLNLLEYYTKMAYEIVGISQLSAMSKKPTGLDSGVSLQTMEDIESDRFETQVNHYVAAFVDIAKVIIEVVDEDKSILPSSQNSSSYAWKEVKEQSDLFKVQYSAATALSKDPQEKLKQIMQLSQVGLITPAKIGQYLDSPDLEDAYAGAEAVADGIEKTIQNAIENEVYEIPEYVNYQQLAQEIAIVENQLYSATSGDAKADKDIVTSLARIMLLEENLLKIMEETGFIAEEANQEAVQSESGIGVGPEQSAVQVNDVTSELPQQAQASTPDIEEAPASEINTSPDPSLSNSPEQIQEDLI